jgi:hypothetical protein
MKEVWNAGLLFSVFQLMAWRFSSLPPDPIPESYLYVPVNGAKLSCQDNAYK